MNYIEKILAHKFEIVGFDGYDMSKMLAYDSYAVNLSNCFRSIKLILGYIFIRPFKLQMRISDSKYLFFLDGSCRFDHKKTCIDFINSMDKINVLKKKHNRKFQFKICLLYQMLFWIKFFMPMNVEMPKRLMYIVTLCYLFRLKEELEELDAKVFQCRVLINLFDGDPGQNLVAQFFKKKGLKTITLQHGFFDVVKEKYICDANSIVRGFVSDVFFVWDEMSKKNAVESGVPENKIVITGPIKYLNSIRKNDYSYKKRFCVYFDGTREYINRNKKMLKCAKKISSDFSLCLCVKLHPSNSILDYPELNDSKIEIIPNCADNSKMLKDFDFVIISGSSLLLEAVYIGTPVFRYVDGDRGDLYAEIPIPTFSFEEELVDMISNFYANSCNVITSQNMIREKLGFPENIKKAYQSAFKNVLYA